MSRLVHQLILDTALVTPNNTALKHKDDHLNYAQLAAAVQACANGLLHLGLGRGQRVAIYAEKRFETVIAMFGAAAAGGVYVPVNPLLKPEQVGHIITDCNASYLITTPERLAALLPTLTTCHGLHGIIVMGDQPTIPPSTCPVPITLWSALLTAPHTTPHRVIDQDMAAILYTSGSTGRPKGVVLSHRNIVAGAHSVAEYLDLTERDRVLSVLPLSFDYGMNQLTTMFLVGGQAVLMNYLFPKDILTILAQEKITGLAAVPPLWIQLSQLTWPTSITDHLRYFTNSGGHMPKETLRILRTALPKTQPFLMYGLTESFRSTFLPPQLIDSKPDSMGKAIPNAEIVVVKEDGTLCAAGEEGELVHRGVLVSLGYWNDPEKTAQRFKPLPAQDRGLPITEMAVWSGDTVKMDDEGFLYFVSRRDEMIKTSGYRISPTEIEEIIYSTKLVSEVAAFGVPHPVLGQAIVVVAAAAAGTVLDRKQIEQSCAQHLPTYMIPAHIDITTDTLPRSPNGKIDRKKLQMEREDLFQKVAQS